MVQLGTGSAKLYALYAVSGLFQLTAELQATRAQQITLLFITTRLCLIYISFFCSGGGTFV